MLDSLPGAVQRNSSTASGGDHLATYRDKLRTLRRYAAERFAKYDPDNLSKRQRDTVDRWYDLTWDLPTKLRVVRQYTGDNFSEAKGYGTRKGQYTLGRLRTVDRYKNVVRELTDRPHRVIEPKPGEKREAFEFTGQKGHAKFRKAIIPVPQAGARYRFEIDKSRPKGSQFVMINTRTKERSWHVPAHVFLDENPNLYEEDEDTPPEFFESVLNEYAERGHVYMIEAGDYHMWGAAGPVRRVAEELSELFKHYGVGTFDPFDKNSHFIGNWFRGVQVFGAGEATSYVNERRRAQITRQEERPLPEGYHVRELRSGDKGLFFKGRLVGTLSRTTPVTRKR